MPCPHSIKTTNVFCCRYFWLVSLKNSIQQEEHFHAAPPRNKRKRFWITMTYSTSSSNDSFDNAQGNTEEANRVCYDCGKTSTTQWRRGEGKTTLCNGCGIRHRRKSGRKVRKYRKRAASWQNCTPIISKRRWRVVASPKSRSAPSNWDVFSHVSDETNTASESDRRVAPHDNSISHGSRSTLHRYEQRLENERGEQRLPVYWRAQVRAPHADNLSSSSTLGSVCTTPGLVRLPPIGRNHARSVRRSHLSDMPGMLSSFLSNPKRLYR